MTFPLFEIFERRTISLLHLIQSQPGNQVTPYRTQSDIWMLKQESLTKSIKKKKKRCYERITYFSLEKMTMTHESNFWNLPWNLNKPANILKSFGNLGGSSYTAQKMKFSIKDFFSKCDRIHSFLRIWSHLLNISLMENFIFREVLYTIFVTNSHTLFHLGRKKKMMKY